MEISELQEIITKSGLSAYKIEKDLGITNGTLGQVLKGKKKLPEKFEKDLRALTYVKEKTKELSEKLNNELAEQVCSGNPTFVKKPEGLIPEPIHLDERGIESNEVGMKDLKPVPVSPISFSEVEEHEATLIIEETEEPISVDYGADYVPVSARNYVEEPEVEEVDLNEYEADFITNEKFDGEEKVRYVPNNTNEETIEVVLKKEVKRPLMDIADLL